MHAGQNTHLATDLSQLVELPPVGPAAATDNHPGNVLFQVVDSRLGELASDPRELVLGIRRVLARLGELVVQEVIDRILDRDLAVQLRALGGLGRLKRA